MRKITFEEARLKWPTPSMYPKKEWDVVCEDRMNGYNTAVDEAEKEIQETTELANRSYQEGLRDGRLPIPGLEKEIAELKSALDTWINKYDQLVIQHNRDNSSQPESDWHTKHLTAHIDFDERLRKLEESAIMDGDIVKIKNSAAETVLITKKSITR